MIERETPFCFTSSVARDTVLFQDGKNVMGKIRRLLGLNRIAGQGKVQAQEKEQAASKHRGILNVNTTTNIENEAPHKRRVSAGYVHETSRDK